jgi:hypothetical protein
MTDRALAQGFVVGSDRAARRTTTSAGARFALASAVGGAGAMALFAWVVLMGRADLLARESFANFYDAQARSLLEGHWDVPSRVVSFERFAIGGKYYMYFGPWPALLRMPVVAFTDGFDGRLSRISMMLAFGVLLGFAARIAWQARVAVRGDGPIGWRALVAASGFVFLVGCGSTALFLASTPWVYHEAILWAAAWAVVSLALLLDYLTSNRGWSLVWATTAATFALLCRQSVGLGAVLALGMLLAVRIAQRGWEWWSPSRHRRQERVWLTRWLGVPSDTARGSIWHVIVATAVPLVAYGYVSYAKFGSVLNLSYQKQDILRSLSPERRAALRATGNSLTGLEYVGSNLLQYLRPDAIGFRETFPWLTFAPGTSRNGLAFDPLEPIASVTATSVLLCVLAVVGIVVAIRAIHPHTDDVVHTARTDDAAANDEAEQRTAAIFRLPIAGAFVAIGATMIVASRAFRYEVDFLPLMVLAGSLGVAWLCVWASGLTRARRRALVAGAVALAAWSVWANFGLALIYGREYSGFQSNKTRAQFIDFQLDVNESLGLGLPTVRHGKQLPVKRKEPFRRSDAPHGDLFVVGNCEGLYIASGRSWQTVEERLPGEHRWHVTFGGAAPGDRQPLWSSGTDPEHILWAHWIDDDHVRFEYQWTGAPDAIVAGNRTLRVDRRLPYEFTLRLDPAGHYVEVRHGKRVLLFASPETFDAVAGSRLGRQPDPELGAVDWPGTIREQSLTPICDRLTDHDGG